MKQIDFVYNKNKKVWHRNGFVTGVSKMDTELHHPFGRGNGIGKCCMHLFVKAKPGHTDNHKWIKETRERLRPDWDKAKKNYVRFLGCKDFIFKECKFCAMPKIKIINKRLKSFDTDDVVTIKPTDLMPDFKEVFSNQSQEILETRKDGAE